MNLDFKRVLERIERLEKAFHIDEDELETSFIIDWAGLTEEEADLLHEGHRLYQKVNCLEGPEDMRLHAERERETLRETARLINPWRKVHEGDGRVETENRRLRK